MTAAEPSADPLRWTARRIEDRYAVDNGTACALEDLNRETHNRVEDLRGGMKLEVGAMAASVAEAQRDVAVSLRSLAGAVSDLKLASERNTMRIENKVDDCITDYRALARRNEALEKQLAQIDAGSREKLDSLTEEVARTGQRATLTEHEAAKAIHAAALAEAREAERARAEAEERARRAEDRNRELEEAAKRAAEERSATREERSWLRRNVVAVALSVVATVATIVAVSVTYSTLAAHGIEPHSATPTAAPAH